LIKHILLAVALALPVAPHLLTGQVAPAGGTPPPALTAGARESLRMRLPPPLWAFGDSLLAEADAGERAGLVGDLADIDDEKTIEFFVALLESDPAPEVRLAILNEIRGDTHPLVRPAVERRAAMDPDASVTLAALEELRAEQHRTVQNILERRLEEARVGGDPQQLALLARAEERFISLATGTMLPSFMQAPPPVFALKAESQPIRVLAFGDFGDGSVGQKEVAAAMLRYHRQTPFDFAVTLGDNFYSKGMESPSDPRWKSWWDELYNPLGIEFYASLGNHDWGFPESPAAEVLYASKSPSWRMPATYYTFTAGPVQFFALDTQALSLSQLLWLDEELGKSTARWKLVYAHHPVFSAGDHGDNAELIARLLPVLRGRADVYLAGHDHDMQHLKPEGSLHFFVAGTGGKLRPIERGPRSLFASSTRGFSVLEATNDRLTVRFMDTELRRIYEHTLRK
jgi:tartrate-resistant acid phosphatase type 5